MEAEAASKRRRVEPDSEEPPVSLDFISHLPDEMLQIIISSLPTKSEKHLFQPQIFFYSV